MRNKSRLFAVVLWVVALTAAASGVIGGLSTAGVLRMATVSDSSAAPLAFKGSLELALRSDTASISVGDVIVPGAHSQGGAVIGEVLALTETAAGTTAATLKAPNFDSPDQWSYELSSSTYRHLVSIPLLGFVLEFFSSFGNPWIVAGLITLAVLLTLVFIRIARFDSNERLPSDWLASLKEQGDSNDDEVLKSFFEDTAATEIVSPDQIHEGSKA